MSENWNQLISALPRPHLLQTEEWAKAKASFGWEAFRRTWEDETGKLIAAAQVLKRSIALPIPGRFVCMMYVPKGPLIADWRNKDLRERVMRDLVDFASEHGAFFIKIDPDIAYESPPNEQSGLGAEFATELQSQGWRFSNEQVQMRNTMVIDLSKSNEELLAAMKQKTRYNLRLAEKKGVRIRHGNPGDFSLLYQMYAETSVRDGFVIRNEGYYRTVWENFYQSGMMIPLLAEVQDEPVAGLMLFTFGKQSWYLYGMSRQLYREWMPNYSLQWEAIKASKAAGCEIYDLWGAPDEFNERDPMWGVYRFKVGLGAYDVHHIGAWDRPLQPLTYSVYTQVLPRLISAMQWRGQRATKRQILAGEPG
ncbi:MAG: lipid II:glycine glycyltransferase FemX [Anaerolineales bacterium]